MPGSVRMGNLEGLLFVKHSTTGAGIGDQYVSRSDDKSCKFEAHGL